MHPEKILDQCDMDDRFFGEVKKWAVISTGDKDSRVTLVEWRNTVGVGIGSNKTQRVRAAKLAVTFAYVLKNPEKCTMR